MLASPTAPIRNIKTTLNYWSSQFDNQITVDFMKPDASLQFANIENMQEAHSVLIHDVRKRESEYKLETHGFQFVHHEVPELDDWSDEQKVAEVLIPKTGLLVREITGAKQIIKITHRIRRFVSDEAKLADNRSPAHSVHSDFTMTGALHHLENVIGDPKRIEELLNGRVQIINVWRPLKTVQRDPLAVCDWTSILPKQDIASVRMAFPNGWNELGKFRFNERHRWHYLGGQQPQEALLFKQFDSMQMEEGGFTLPHSAFEDPTATSTEPRESIEIKMFAFG